MNCGRAWICARTWPWWPKRRAHRRHRPKHGGVDRRRDALGAFAAADAVLALLGVAAGAALIARLGYSANLVHITENAAALLRDFVLVVAAINGWFLYRHRGVFGAVVAGVSEAADELKLLSEVLVRLERERFKTPMLAELRASLDAGGEPPSARLRELKRLMEYIDSRDNIFVRIAEIFILWTPYWAVQVEAWRRRSGTVVRRWLVAVGEIEALCSLASHAFEHPQDCFPGFVGDGPFLEAEAAHPLLPEDVLNCAKTACVSAAAGRRGSWWSAAPTCRARARSCERWE